MISVVNKIAKELFDYCKHRENIFKQQIYVLISLCGVYHLQKKFNHLVYNAFHIVEDIFFVNG